MKKAVFPLLLLVSLAVLFQGAFFRGESLFVRDIQAFYRPAKSLLVPLTRASSGLPLWNPAFSSGQPFAANPEHQLFHPLTALFFVLPFEWAFRLQFVLPVLVAAFSMRFLLRTFGLHADAAALGGLSWGMGGYTLSTMNLLPILLAIAVLPAVLAFAVRVFVDGGPSNVAGLAVSVGLECLGGEPSTLLMTAILLPASLAHATPQAGPPGAFRRRALLLLSGLLLGTAIGAATLLPGIHLASKTVRAGGLSDTVADAWSMPPVRILELAYPTLLGHVEQPDERWYWGRTLYPNQSYPFIFSIYPGLLVALLAGITAFREARRRWAWIATLVLGALLAVGTHLPLWHLARRVLPPLRGLRYPEKFVLLVMLAVTVLASVGMEELCRERQSCRRPLFWSLASVSLLSVVSGITLLAFEARLGSRVFESWGVSPALAALWAPVAARDAVSTGVVAVSLLAVLVLGARPSTELPGRWAGWLLLAVTTADLVLAGRPLLPTKPVESLSAPPPVLVPLIRSRPSGPLFHYAAWDPKVGAASGICRPPIPAQWGLSMTLENDFDLTQLRWSHEATEKFFEAISSDPSLFAPLLVRRGVSAVLRLRPGVTGEVGGERQYGAEGPLQLLRIRDPAPLVFCASRVVSAAGAEGWLQAVKRLGKGSATAAVVDPLEIGPVPQRVSDGRVEHVLFRPGKLSFDVAADGPDETFVAINQTWDDAWLALVDGAPARLVRTDISLSGLLVRPGRHRVSLSYSDRWLTAGLLVSALALVSVLVLLVSRVRPTRPSPAEGQK